MKRHLCYNVLILIAILTMDIAISCGGPKSLGELSARELYLKGKQKYEKGKYLPAIEKFQRVVFNYPGDAVVDTAQYYLAMSYFRNNEYELSSVEFNRLAINYPSSAFFERAIFMRAVSFFESTPSHYGLDQSDLTNAIRQFEDFIIDFPESEVVVDARQYLLLARTRMAKKFFANGKVYSLIGAPKAAKIYYQRVIDDYTDTEFAAPATYQYALMEYKLKHFKEARQKFENFVAVFPDHELAADAAKNAVKAAFKNCDQLYNQNDSVAARSCLEQFLENYPDDNNAKKAGKILQNLTTPSQTEVAGKHAGT